MAPFFALNNNVDAGHINPDLDATWRAWVGYQFCNGLGVRGRYWEFENENFEGLNPAIGGADRVFHNWDTWAVDIEIIDSTKLGCHWDMTFGIGYRYVEYEESVGASVTATGALTQALRKEFTGHGLTASAEIRRQICHHFAAFANFRGSALFGDEDYFRPGTATDTGITTVLQRQFNDFKFICEVQAGLEVNLPICCGGYYYARGGLELQHWESFGLDASDARAPGAAVGFVDTDTNIGFAGFMVELGLRR